jgi:transposase InsO family protein
MHPRPRLNPYGRLVLVQRIQQGWSVPAAAEAVQVSRATAPQVVAALPGGRLEGLQDRPCRPHHSPRRLSHRAEAEVLELRRQRKLGPHRLAALTGHPRSTVYKVLRRHQLHRLDWLDRPTGRLIRRYERQAPGELIHVDVKKLGRIPDGGGWRVLGREHRPNHHRGQGYDFIHSALDDHSRLAYSEILPDERGSTCADFLRRAADFFAAHGIRPERVMTDNALNYGHSRDFQAALADMEARHLRTPRYTPRVNGKVERFNRTLLEEWAYVTAYPSNQARAALLPEWLHLYNYHRAHTALGGLPPVARVNRVCGNYS